MDVAVALAVAGLVAAAGLVAFLLVGLVFG